MHEREKLQEAEYFYGQIVDPVQSRGFIYNLRALLGSARSILVYAHKETKGRRDAKQWYEEAVQDPVIKFLRDARHVDVHTRPVGTNQTIQLMPASVTVGGYPHMTSMNRPPPVTTHHFAGWNGSEDVLALCRGYLDRLAAFIEDGQARGFLTR